VLRFVGYKSLVGETMIQALQDFRLGLF